MVSDGELLRRFSDDGSQAAFTTLVQRHLNVVYRTALRRTGGDAHSACDVTQRVFTAVARKAASLKGRSSLTGWLYTSTRYAAAEVVRADQRRRRREEEAHAMAELNVDVQNLGEKFEPLLDEILERLPDRDREAVLLHYFEGRTFSEIGQTLSTTADAARMRVNRALERMRGEMVRRGVASSAAALSTFLSVQSAQASSAPLASAVSARALAGTGTGVAGSGVLGKALVALKSSPWIAGVSSLVLLSGAAATSVHYVKDVQRTEVLSEEAIIETGQPTMALTIGETPRGPVNGPISAQRGVHAPASNRNASKETPAVWPSAAENFDQLSLEERNLLAMLWMRLDKAKPRFRPVMRIGNRAPNSAAVDVLLAQGWVALSHSQVPGSRSVYLASEGIEFCRANRAAVEAHTPTGNVRKQPGPQG